jgi:hypothetical protein
MVFRCEGVDNYPGRNYTFVWRPQNSRAVSGYRAGIREFKDAKNDEKETLKQTINLKKVLSVTLSQSTQVLHGKLEIKKVGK